MRGENLKLVDILKTRNKEVLEAWIKELMTTSLWEKGFISEENFKKYCSGFLSALLKAISDDNLEDITQPEYEELISQLTGLSSALATQECTSSEVGKYIFSFKDSVLKFLEEEYEDRELLNKQIIRLFNLTEKLAGYSAENFEKNRVKVISKQVDEIMEISTPVVNVWEGILVVPLIGIVDSKRAQMVTEKLLNMIVKTHSLVVIIDITGVPSVDTEVASHLTRTCNAVKLLGAEAIITGISPSAAQTIIHLGIDVRGITTRAELADGVELALRLIGKDVTEAKKES